MNMLNVPMNILISHCMKRKLNDLYAMFNVLVQVNNAKKLKLLCSLHMIMLQSGPVKAVGQNTLYLL